MATETRLYPRRGLETVELVPQVGAEPVRPRRARNHETNLEPLEEGTGNSHHTLNAERGLTLGLHLLELPNAVLPDGARPVSN
jgi:hypothetical protein